jgi:uncharacterized protein YerC
MPHISKHMPSGQVWDKIYNDLLAHLVLKGSERDRARIARELFTSTERIMLAKRLALVCMLGEGYTFEDIQETLRMSPSTVGKVWKAMQKGKYQSVVSIVHKRKVFDVLTALLPRPYTAPRWGTLKK